MKLVDEFGTKFFTMDFVDALRVFLQMNKDKEIDIAEARFVPVTMEVIQNLVLNEGIDIIDSERKDRNDALLQIREQRALLNVERVELPVLKNYLDLLDYLRALDPEVYYVPIKGEKTHYNVLLIMLIMIYRPKIKIIIDGIFTEFYPLLNDAFTEEQFTGMRMSTNEFLFVNGKRHFTRVIEGKDVNTPIEVDGHIFTWRDIRTRYLVFPTYFGKVPVHKGEYEEYFRGVIGTVRNKMIRELEQRKHDGLRDFLRGGI